MLNSLSIDHFAIIESGHIHFDKGMTVITGETGAGKSILLDALELALGARCDKALLKDKQKTTICAVFDIQTLDSAKRWLSKHELNTEDNECILRRTLQKDGSSKAYINGIAVTLTQVKNLARLLVGIYGQHAHYDLLSSKEQLIKLDTYLNAPDLIKSVKAKYQLIEKIDLALNELYKKQQQAETEQSLLIYQLNELNELALQDDEIDQLDRRQNELAHASEQLDQLHQICSNLYEDDQNLIGQLERITYQLSQAHFNQSIITEPFQMLEQAKLLLNEAYDELNQLKNSIEINPEALDRVNHRLSQIHTIARKHKTSIDQLYQHQQQLQNRLSELNTLDAKIKRLQIQKAQAIDEYDKSANLLSDKRKHIAKAFAKRIKNHIRKLNTPKAEFEVIFSCLNHRSESGIDHCEFMISFNPGEPLMPIQKVASGGELSRIGLTIQVTASEKVAPPTLIFDEVDVGISGATAEIVGQLLSVLSEKAQILCITHQAQVASQGHQHLHVYKTQKNNKTLSFIKELDKNQRIEAIANIIGGVNLTDQTMLHAKEMINKFSPQISPK
ncbi:DNA repair protein RecN [Thiotrichales bacterium 19S3-7]|nr:DNA repair protein RecN [Thiotrichales bacterium 19S3-7]MCF6800850.1 DNA repair protein RecN [Thiotrichales bacterium 19S3-11]